MRIVVVMLRPRIWAETIFMEVGEVNETHRAA